MNTQSLFADAAWFRLAVVGIDILAVITIVRLWSAIAAWWQAPFPHRSVALPARLRSGPGRPGRR